MKKIKKTLSVTLLMLGLVSVGAGAGFVAKNAVVEPVAARAEIYPDWTCAVNKISATSDSTSSVIYGEVVDGAVDEIDEETLFTLHEGSGAGFALNGEAFTPVSVMAPANNVVRIDLGFEAQAGDVVTVSGAFSNADWEMTIEFNNCALQFDGSAWVAVGGSETPDVPEVNDNVSDLGAAVSASGTNKQVYLAFTSGVTLPINSWDYAFSYVSGNGITVNDTMISMVNSVKSVGDKFFVDLGAEAVEGDVLKIGGTFACESQGVQYVIADSEFVWNGSAWVSTAEPEEPPVQTYTTHDLGALTLHVNSKPWGGAGKANNQLYLERADGEALPFMSWDYFFHVGEDGYFKLNDQVVTPNEIKCTDAGFFWLFNALNAGDTITIGGTFVCEDQFIKYTVAESKFTWTGENWEVYKAPVEIEYTTYNVNNLGIAGGCTADVVYAYVTDGDELPGGDWDNSFSFEAGSGAGMKLNGVEISGWEIKQPGDFYIKLSAAAVAGDTLTIDGAYYNEATAKRFVFNNCTVTFNGTGWEAPSVEPEEPEQPPVEGYTTYDIGALVLHVNSTVGGASGNNNQLYLTRADEEALPILSWDFLFTVGEGGYFKINDEVVTPNAIKSTGDGFFWEFTALNAGDTITIGGTFVCDAQTTNYNIVESKFTWTGTGWEVPSVEPEEPEQPEQPEVEYTTYNVNNLGIAGGCTADVVYAYVTDGDELPGGDWDNAFSFEAGSGAGMKLNGVEISGWEIKQPGDFYIKLSAAAVAGDTLTIDGAYYNEATAKRFVFNNCTVTFNGTGWEAPSVEPEEPEQPEQPEIEYTTYNVNNLGIAGGCTADVVYAYVTDGDELPGGDWDNAFSFEAGSGAGMKLNGVEISGWEIKQPGDFYIKLSAAAVAGDTLTIDGAYYNEATAKRFVFNNCTVTFNGTAWEAPSVEPENPEQPENPEIPEEPEQPEVEYVVNDLGAAVSASGTNKQVYLAFASGVTLSVDSWDYAFSYVSGNGITVNGAMISMENSVKSVGNKFFMDLGAEAGEGAVLKIGGTFACESQQVKYVIADSEFVWDGSAWVSTAEPEEPPVQSYTTHDLGALTLHVNSKPWGDAGTANHQLYLERVDGEALPLQDWAFLFTVGEDGYFMVNDQVVTPIEIKSTDAGFFWMFAPLSAGDTITIGGTFVCEDKAIKYVVSESKFTWNGTNWEVYREPVVYTTYALGQVILLNADSTDSLVYFDPASGEKLPVTDDTWAEKLTFLAGSGVGITLNGAPIDMNDIKIPNTMYVGLGTVVSAGDVLVIGGTFYNDNLAIKYVIEESTFTYDGETWISTLEVARANAKQEIDTYLADFAQSEYYAAQWEEIITIVNTAKARIDVASESGLAAIVNQAKTQIDNVETKEEVDVVLVTARNNAKMDLAGYKQEEDYKEAEWQVIQDAITAANAKINAATTEAEIQAAVAEAKAAIDAVKTAAELDAEQLKAWRDEAKATVQAYYDAIDFTKYSTEDNTKLAGYVATAMKAIEEETDKAKIDEIVAQFKANVDGVTGAEEDSGCGSVGVASGCLLGGLTMVAAAVALRKKKED